MFLYSVVVFECFLVVLFFLFSHVFYPPPTCHPPIRIIWPVCSIPHKLKLSTLEQWITHNSKSNNKTNKYLITVICFYLCFYPKYTYITECLNLVTRIQTSTVFFSALLHWCIPLDYRGPPSPNLGTSTEAWNNFWTKGAPSIPKWVL
jgi:hypothetical protein